jgi:hypothetical protein
VAEVPWFSSPPDAWIKWEPIGDLGHLHFVDPQGNNAVVHVTNGSTRAEKHYNVWHIDVQGDIATVSPSVHYVGCWHTPNPVLFRLVDSGG